MKKNPEASTFIKELKTWKKEMTKLRKILLNTKLVEEWKWKQPCYTINGKNVVILSSFKEHCSLSFFKGSLLKDPNGLLISPGENSQATRQFRFTDTKSIEEMESSINKFITEAIKIELAGEKVNFSKEKGVIPQELASEFKKSKKLEKAFNSLTPGRQRAYLLFFNAAKTEVARKRRVEKYMPKILCGKGMNDCTCGLSKRMPSCDGSHKYA